MPSILGGVLTASHVISEADQTTLCRPRRAASLAHGAHTLAMLALFVADSEYIIFVIRAARQTSSFPMVFIFVAPAPQDFSHIYRAFVERSTVLPTERSIVQCALGTQLPASVEDTIIAFHALAITKKAVLLLISLAFGGRSAQATTL